MKLTDKEISLARFCVENAIKQGAKEARASLSKSVSDTYSMRDGEIDKVSHCADLSIFLHLFVDGKYFTCSTNRLGEKELEDFIAQAIASARLLEKDECRRLPDQDKLVKDAVTGLEPGLYDPEYETITPDERLLMASKGMDMDAPLPEGLEIISWECEYGDNIDDNFICDSLGTQARHTETAFSISSEVMLEDQSGRKYSGFWWDNSPYRENFRPEECAKIALKSALERVGAEKSKSAVTNMIVDRSAASRFIGPILNSLFGMSIQQKSSFLCDSLGKKVFSEKFSFSDNARAVGQNGARLFDTEGVATQNREIVSNGVVKTYFIDTWSSMKMGMPATIEGPSRLEMAPYPAQGLNLEQILERCGEGILITGFNGGNCNQTTGDFSYGIEGFEVINGKKGAPIHEMLVTGNMIDLWNKVLYIGSDALGRSRWQIPTLAFEGISFTA